MVKNYVKTAWRNIKKHKNFSAINAGGLILGITSCLLLLLYVSYHLSYDHQFSNLKNIYIVENNEPGDGKIYTFAATPRLLASTIKSEVPGVMQSARVISYTADGLISYNANSFKKNGLFADANFFSIFSYHFIQGNPVNALAQPNSIVITKGLAQTLFGKLDPMNRIITRNDKLQMMVTGVIEDIPANSTFQFDYVLPWALFETSNPWAKNADWGINYANTIIELKSPSDLNKANSIIQTMIGKHSDGNKNQAFLFPFADLHLRATFENGKSIGGLIGQMHLFEILAIGILLIACVNFMNLSTARSEKRAKEVGIRKAIGSSRKILIGQFITESLILSIISTICAVILLGMVLPFFNSLLNIKLTMPVRDWYSWLFVAALAVFTGLISGSYPAFYLSAFQPIKVLKGIYKGGKNALPLRKVLVVVQFAFAVFLITATICIYKQIRFIQNRPEGYDKNNLVEISVEGSLDKKADLLISELKSTGAITNGTVVSQRITQNGNDSWSVQWPGEQPDQKILFDIFNTGFDFTQTTGVKLMSGREFSNQYPEDTAGKTAMINETAAKLMNLKNPVGTIIKSADLPLTIVGVYKDFVRGNPYTKISPTITTYAGNGALAIDMRLNPAKNITNCIDQINKTLKSLNPAYPPAVQFVDSEFEKKFENEKLLAYLANLFGGLAILISCLGLFGLAAFSAEQRTKEIGVRKVLGASVGNIAALLSKEFLKLVAISIIIAIPVSVWALDKWLQNYEYRISLSWWIMAVAGFITLVIALITVSYQAVKAGLLNPVKSLKNQ